MTPDELREAVARAIYLSDPEMPKDVADTAADAALATVREALREPTRIKTATGFGIPTTTAVDIWRAMLAASPLGGPGHE